MPLRKRQHHCKKKPKGYTSILIKFFKETIDGWNWNLIFCDPLDPRFRVCYHITYCPFCGKNLEDSK